jgi:hypothetical protein
VNQVSPVTLFAVGSTRHKDDKALTANKAADEIRLKNSFKFTSCLYGAGHNNFDAGKSITRVIGKGVGPEIRDFFGP